MSESSNKKKEFGVGSVKFDMTSEDTSSRGAYNLAIGLTVLAGCAVNYLMSVFFSDQLFKFMQTSPWIVLILYFVGSIAGIFIVNKTQNPVTGILGFGLLAVSMGMVLTAYISFYTEASVTTAFLITMGITGVMTLAASVFPAFFASLGKGLGIMLLITIIGELVFSLILRKNLGIFDYIVIFIFCGYIGFDWTRAQQRPATIVNAIRSAAAIYVDIVNIFIRILSIMGKRRD